MVLRVSAIQLKFEFSSSPQEFFDRVSCPVEDAVEQGAQLVAFPDLTGLMLLGATDPIAEGGFDLQAIARPVGCGTGEALLHKNARTLYDFQIHLFGAVAKKWQVYVAAGTVIQEHESALYKVGHLFGPDGTIAGTQMQTHRSQQEIAWGLAQGDTLKVFDIGVARIGLVLGEDVRYPEVARILALQNANLLIHSAAYSAYHESDYLLDIWRDVQSNQVFGIQACAVGPFIGRSAVYAPVEMTPAHTGTLARALDADSEQVVTADLDFDALQHVVDEYPIFDYFNEQFYHSELADSYPDSD